MSGGYLYDRKLVEYLESQGDQVTIFSLPQGQYGMQVLQNFTASLSGALADTGFDVLLQDELNHPSLFWLNRRVRTRINYPVVSIVHHLRLSEPMAGSLFGVKPFLERCYLNSVDAYIYNSETTRQVVEGLVGVIKPCIVAYPAGNRLAGTPTRAQIQKRSHAQGSLRVLFLGNVIPRKGLHTLMDALDQLPPESWQLHVAGSLDMDPSYARSMLQKAKSMKRKIQIHFEGSLQDSDLSELLLRCHVLAIPSSYEGFGIAYLEGMSFGLPAIGGAAGGAVEIITPGRDGFLIKKDDVDSLASHLHTLAHDRDLLEKMSHAARRRFLGHPGWDQSMEHIRAFLLELI